MAGGRGVTVRVNQAACRALGHGPDAVRMMTRVGERVLQEQKRLCPVSPVGGDRASGTLRSSLRWELEAEPGRILVRVGTDDPVGLFVVLGTRPHPIDAKGPYPLRNRASGQVFGPHVDHPGTEPQDFMRPSLDVVAGAIS